MLHLLIVSALLGAVTSANGEMMFGGIQNQDPRNPEFMSIAWKAAKTLNEDSSANPGPYAMMPIKVLKAHSQVVAGFIYELDVLYGESDCKKNKVGLARLQMGHCKLMKTGTRAVYKVHYFARPWQNYEQISVSKMQSVIERQFQHNRKSGPFENFKVDGGAWVGNSNNAMMVGGKQVQDPSKPEHTNNAMMVGGKEGQDPSKPEYMEIARKAAKNLNEDPTANPGQYVMMPMRVLKAQSQIVSGVVYNLDVLYGESGCKKQEVDLGRLDMTNCTVMDKGKRAIYKIEYYAIPWKNHEEISVKRVQI